MQSMMYALVDCNNFFVSCERVFNPKLHNRPVVVLSNNDGCVISRSNEAKQLGIAMGEPYFKIRDLIRQHNVAVLSSNFALYGDLSSRVMNIIMHYFPQVFIYSVDEAFIDLSTLQHSFDIYNSCVILAQKVEQYTGVPVSIGLAVSKTLAKVANHVAKKQDPNASRVFYLNNPQITAATLQNFAVGDVWGIGRKLQKKLHAMGIFTVEELIKLSPLIIKTNFNIVMQRTILELQGIDCIELKENTDNKKQIMISRSFGQRVTNLEHLQEALATYASMACEKLRKQGSTAGGIYVFLHTGLHGSPETVYRNSLYINLPHPSADTREIITIAKQGLQQLFKSGYRYQKVGIVLCDFAHADSMQIDLFGHVDLTHSEDLMHVVDNINKRFGRTTIQFAAAGIEKPWRTQATKLSTDFTSNWQTLPVVHCRT